MSDTGDRDDELSPAERGLSAHLDLLRANPPATTPDLIAGVLRRVRWQVTLRDPLIFIGAVSGAFFESLSLLSAPTLADR